MVDAREQSSKIERSLAALNVCFSRVLTLQKPEDQVRIDGEELEGVSARPW